MNLKTTLLFELQNLSDLLQKPKAPSPSTKPKPKTIETPAPPNGQLPNPIVDSVLGATSGPVNYNCCAVCGTAFRLTTDLVQHMRNNHRQSRYKRKAASSSAKEEDWMNLCIGLFKNKVIFRFIAYDVWEKPEKAGGD
jgi:hypothetical protein